MGNAVFTDKGVSMAGHDLKLTSPMMHGPAVKRIQELLQVLGYDVPPDGIFGRDTHVAVMAFQKKINIKVDGVVGEGTAEALENYLESNDDGDDDLSSASDNNDDDDPVNSDVVDLRDQHPAPANFSHKRPWSEISGVTLHQTGCQMSNKPKRWHRLNAHIGITRDGKVLIVNDPTDMIWHAQGLSKHTIGIEICGNFSGIDGNSSTLWKGGGGPHTLTSGMEAALQTAFDWIKTQFQNNGQEWKHVHAHRQSSKTRTSDPGSEIWQKIAMPWITSLGATDGGPDWKKGDGKPVPKLLSAISNAEWEAMIWGPYRADRPKFYTSWIDFCEKYNPGMKPKADHQKQAVTKYGGQ